LQPSLNSARALEALEAFATTLCTQEGALEAFATTLYTQEGAL